MQLIIIDIIPGGGNITQAGDIHLKQHHPSSRTLGLASLYSVLHYYVYVVVCGIKLATGLLSGNKESHYNRCYKSVITSRPRAAQPSRMRYMCCMRTSPALKVFAGGHSDTTSKAEAVYTCLDWFQWRTTLLK